MSRQERLAKRNEKIKQRFDTLTKQYPHWRMDAIIGKLSEEFYISKSRIYMIFKKE